ncbi:hypothetical protein SMICM17S_04799 [Streptomyces microflavus]
MLVLALRRAFLAVEVVRHVGPVLRVSGVERPARGQAPLLDAEVDAPHGLAGVRRTVAESVVDVIEVTTSVVRGDGRLSSGCGDVTPVVVRLVLPVVGHGIAVHIDDVVELPAPRLLAPGGRERSVVAGFSGLIAEDGYGEGRVGRRVVGGRSVVAPPRKSVQSEEVLRAVRRGDLPVFTDAIDTGSSLVTISRSGELFDLLSGVLSRVPAALAVSHQFGRSAAQRQRGVVVVPALIPDLRGVGPAFLVVLTDLVPPLDVTRLPGPTVTDPAGLVVRCGCPAVDTLG